MIVSVSIPLDGAGEGTLRVDSRAMGWATVRRIVAVMRHGTATAAAPPAFTLTEGRERLAETAYLPVSEWTRLDHSVEGALALRIDVSGGAPAGSEYLTFCLEA